MGTQLKQWTVRLLAAGALPAMLTLGLGTAASAQPATATRAVHAEHASHDRDDYEVYGPFDSYSDCEWHAGEYRYHRAICEPGNQDGYHHCRCGHGESEWFLYVWYDRW